eukprot:GHVQ01000514.1.p1 GENE.GHVQ01000514.1~~GHVQ01000514.1.p1  ORF type:complete len:110 (+),score=20.06 GHVQ01000514.1:507-836(+)
MYIHMNTHTHIPIYVEQQAWTYIRTYTPRIHMHTHTAQTLTQTHCDTPVHRDTSNIRSNGHSLTDTPSQTLPHRHSLTNTHVNTHMLKYTFHIKIEGRKCVRQLTVSKQ